MSSKLKKLVGELEVLVAERGNLLDARARESFTAQLENLKRAIEEEDAEASARLVGECLMVTAEVLSIVTNVMTLLK